MLDFYHLLPPEGAKILLVLFLSFLIGLEREEHHSAYERSSFGGVRTFPLIGLTGYLVALLSPDQILPVIIGLAVVGSLLTVSYWNKVKTSGLAGMTSEMSALTTYLVGALVTREQLWIATTVSVACMLLLEFKGVLEGLSKRIAAHEILTFTKFLLLTAVVLPVLPNRAFGPFEINPFKTWLVVVAVSGVSYGSYVIQNLTKGGILLAAVLGGAYSSTATTIALARRAAREQRPHLFSGATLTASGMMYLRLAVLVTLFNRDLMFRLGPPFVVLGVVAIAAGWLWTRLPDANTGEVAREYKPANPLELRSAFLFAALFVAMLIATHLVVDHLGKAGVYTLGVLMGAADVDPFIMGMTAAAGKTAPLLVACAAISIAAASNNVAKGVYAYMMSDRKTGVLSFAMLVALAIAGLIPLIWVAR
jgi:uncharacterized membrane protein (DUF4010 family)